MANDPIPFKAPPVPPEDADDIEALFLDPALGDGLTDQVYHSIPVGKPKDFFRVCPLAGYRRRTELYVHKVEGQIEEQYFIVAPSMRGKITEARSVTLVVCIHRDESLRVWASSTRTRTRRTTRRGCRHAQSPALQWISG
jgi:hypothetical protein